MGDLRLRGGLATIALAALLGFIPSSSQGLIIVGSISTPGLAYDLEVVEGLAYVADGESGLRIINVSELGEWVELGALDTPGSARDVAVAGELAFVADVGVGLRIVDISDSAAPVPVGALPMPGIGAEIELDGRHAYTPDDGFGLRVIDVSSPAEPLAIGAFATPEEIGDIDVVDGIAYVANGYLGLRILDVSDPTTPVEIGSHVSSDFAYGVAVVNEVAYVVGGGELFYKGTRFIGENILRAVDISDPSAPVELGWIATRDYGKADIVVLNGLAYVGGLYVFDVSDPAAPVALGLMSAGGDAEIVDGLAFVPRYPGIAAIDISKPNYPKVVAGMYPRKTVRSVKVEDDVVFAEIVGGLETIDVADPASPLTLGFYPGYWGLSAFDGDLAFGISQSRGLLVLDKSNPAALEEIGALEPPYWTGGEYAVSGSFAYTSAWDVGGFQVVDVSNPTMPFIVGSLEGSEGQRFSAVKVVGNFAYLVDRQWGLTIVDIAVPADPVEVSFLAVGVWYGDWFYGGAWDIDVVDGIAYLACFGNGLRMVDVSDPVTPIEVGVFDQGTFAMSVNLRDHLAYVGEEYEGLSVIDIADPSLPEIVYERFHGGRSMTRVEFAGDLAYIPSISPGSSDRGFGLEIMDFGPEYAPTIVVDIDIRPGASSNQINLSGVGVLAVAILGSDEFDISQIDGATLALGPSDAPLAHRGGPHLADLNGDGYLDLLAHFRTDESGIAYGDQSVCITGESLDGRSVSGCDSVSTLPEKDDRPVH